MWIETKGDETINKLREAEILLKVRIHRRLSDKEGWKVNHEMSGENMEKRRTQGSKEAAEAGAIVVK